MPVEINGAQAQTDAPRAVPPALLRGARGLCPACGTGRMFRAYLKVEDACGHCGEELHHQRADDAPPYFTMFIVGHIVVGGLLSMERAFAPPTWVQLSVWLPLTIVLCLLLLPVVKGTLVALQWALRMHGFGSFPDPAAPLPDPAEQIGRTATGSAG
jgi:uncharacterized protein (DUF983 family)